MIIQCRIVLPGMEIYFVVGKIIPLTARILVMLGHDVALECVVHEYFPESLPFRELPYPTPGGDGIECKGLNNNSILRENRKNQKKEGWNK